MKSEPDFLSDLSKVQFLSEVYFFLENTEKLLFVCFLSVLQIYGLGLWTEKFDEKYLPSKELFVLTCILYKEVVEFHIQKTYF